jgi:hypothetical protein
LLLGTAGQVIRYDAVSGELSAVASLGQSVRDLDVAADGSVFRVVGLDEEGSGQMWPLEVDELGQLAVADPVALSLGEPRAIEYNVATDSWAIGSDGGSAVTYLRIWSEGSGFELLQAYKASAGLSDLMWSRSIFGEMEDIVTGH